MISYSLAWFINLIINAIMLLLIAHVILSYFMNPFHPVRQTIDRIINPLLNPIRQVVPPMGGLDFSPIVLWLILRLTGNILIQILNNLSL
jgi:YggT family protein